jgi:hypothetical protein
MEDAINDPRYAQQQDRKERKEKEDSPFSFLEKQLLNRINGKRLAFQIAKQAAMAVVRSPAGPYIIAGAVLLVLIFCILMFASGGIGGLGSGSSDTVTAPAPGTGGDGSTGGGAGGGPAPIPITPGVIPPFPNNIPAALQSQFNITISGFGVQHQQWVWELVWENTNTKFPQLLSGLVVQATSGGISYQAGCGSPGVYLGQYNGAAFFKFIATHEFGHYIQACKPRAETKLNESINAMSLEGGISWYSANGNPACFSSTTNWKENHADTIAYYLHPNAGLSSGPRNCVPASFQNPPNPFYGTGSYPLQFGIARSILTL